MNYTYDQLRLSFDNILKELDDICKSIDDLTEIDQMFDKKFENKSTYSNVKTKIDHFEAKKLNRTEISYPRENLEINSNFQRNCKTQNLKRKTINTEFTTNNNFNKQNLYTDRIKSNIFKNHRLPNDKESNSSLSNQIGSAKECTEVLYLKSLKSNSSPIATNTKINQVKTTHNNQILNNNQVSFSNNNNNSHDTNLNDDYESNSSKYQQTDCINSNNVEDNDYLSENEIIKIKSFYDSINCFVFVSSSIAELYQIKREDEFDRLGIDPVNEYNIYMQNKLKKDLKLKTNQELSDEEKSTNKSTVNYMYKTSGVPVIIFNFIDNYKRKKDLRIVLAERSTGFCMFEFKFDQLTQFENVNEVTAFRLSTISKSAKTSINTTNKNISYQNEYFEKYFNCKRRHAYKEHLLKFALKNDCDEFYIMLLGIMNDKKNSEYSVTSENRSTSNNHYRNNERNIGSSNYSLSSMNNILNTYQDFFSNVNNPLNSSTLLICHFDTIDNNFVSNNKNSSLISLNFSNFDTLSTQDEQLDTLSVQTKKSSLKPAKLQRNYSLSSSNLIPFTFDKNRYAFNRRNSLLTKQQDSYSIMEQSNYDYDRFALDTKTLSRSVIDLEELNRKQASILEGNYKNKSNQSNKNLFKSFLSKYRKLKKSDISNPVNFNHIAHLDNPVPIGKRYQHY